MKYIIFFYIFTLVSWPLCAMEKQIFPTTFKQAFNAVKNQYTIFAYRDNQFAGNLFYKQSDKDSCTWKLMRLSTEQNFKRQGIATSLFSILIEQLHHKKAKLLKWKAEPLNENIDPETLEQVYTKIMSHLNLLDHFESEKIQTPNGNSFYKMRLTIPEKEKSSSPRKIDLTLQQAGTHGQL